MIGLAPAWYDTGWYPVRDTGGTALARKTPKHTGHCTRHGSAKASYWRVVIIPWDKELIPGEHHLRYFLCPDAAKAWADGLMKGGHLPSYESALSWTPISLTP